MMADIPAHKDKRIRVPGRARQSREVAYCLPGRVQKVEGTITSIVLPDTIF